MTRLSRRLIGITGMSDIVQRRIPVLTLDSKVPGPVVWMTACIHGDEVGGTAIVHDVMESLRHGALQAGTVHAFPLINSMGFENVSRYINADREDLNRCFPGSTTGTMGEQIARRLFDSIVKTKPDIVIDLHNDWIHSVPYLLIDPPDCFATKALHNRTLRLARETGLLTVEDDSSPRASTTMSGAAVAAGIASLTLEAGGACGVVEEGVAAGKAAVLAILAQLGMTTAMPRDRLPNSHREATADLYEPPAVQQQWPGPVQRGTGRQRRRRHGSCASLQRFRILRGKAARQGAGLRTGPRRPCAGRAWQPGRRNRRTARSGPIRHMAKP